ncbi:hypothetical protein [Vulcanococcus limneticus]|uniref:hypothetical protein n=1 Tax=Vulcanococcus limneticus TaxID=2170428 RepID=UPI00398BE8C5
MSLIVNPFDRSDLFLETKHHAIVAEAISRADGEKPFKRYIDAWWLALCIGVRKDHRVKLSGDTTKFNDGGIFSSDPWRIIHLQLLGLSWLGSTALDHPTQIIQLSSEYVNGGIEWIVDTIHGQPNRTLAIYNRISEFESS